MIVGLSIEKINIPHEPGEWMLLREGLSPYQMDRCIESRLQESREASAPIIASVGMDAFRDIVLGLAEGRSARDLAKEANAPQGAYTGRHGDSAARGRPRGGARPRGQPAARPEGLRPGSRGLLPLCGLVVQPPVKVKNIQRLDATTRDWLHGMVMARMPIEDPAVTEGNS